MKAPRLRPPELRLPELRRPQLRLPDWKRPGGLSGWQRVVVIVGLAVALLVTMSVAAAARVGASSGRILAGVQVGGVDVGGMTREEAIAAVKATTEPKLRRGVTVVSGKKRWPVTPAGLGHGAAVDQAVDRALVGPELSSVADFWHRLTNKPVAHTVDIARSENEAKVRGFVLALAPRLAVAPVDASIKLVDGRVVRQKAKAGRALDIRASTRALAKGLRGNARRVRLVTRPVAPKVTEDELGKTIEINLATNRLTFYDGLKVRRVYPVATGQPSFPTPQGSWEVVYKRVNPTWTNPAPDGWGADMPKSIPPGPGNPLGTRAMSLNASGILIHGTYAAGSIGTYASHGCIRMHLSDVEALYPRVPIGTKVLIHR
jgi:lipoprotein-anchoring transpeptidase ErfK/SrfK